MCLSCEDIARQSCAMVSRWRIFGDFLGPAFPASHLQHISDMHSKFALRPHHVWKYDRHPSATAEVIGEEKKKKEEEERNRTKNIYMSASATQGGHNKLQGKNIMACAIP